MPGSVGTGFFVLTMTFWPSQVIESHSNIERARGALSSVRCSDFPAASPVTLLPLENTARSSIVNVQVSLSSLIFHSFASQGTEFIFVSNLTRHSPKPYRMTTQPK